MSTRKRIPVSINIKSAEAIQDYELERRIERHRKALGLVAASKSDRSKQRSHDAKWLQIRNAVKRAGLNTSD